MKIEDYFDFLEPNDIRIKRHRIGIESILFEYIHNSLVPEEILDRFPTLNLEQIYATILYYQHNKQQIEKYLDEWLKHGDNMRSEQSLNPPAAVRKLRRVRTKQELKKQKLSEN
jgi:uncharacterized protein (DUF433 family)